MGVGTLEFFFGANSVMETIIFHVIVIRTQFKRKTNKKINTNLGQNEDVNLNGYGHTGQYSEEKSYSTQHYESKIPLKLVMDPRGIVQDVHTTGITYDHSTGMLSPDKCAELVSALHTDTPKGKGSYFQFFRFFLFHFKHKQMKHKHIDAKIIDEKNAKSITVLYCLSFRC